MIDRRTLLLALAAAPLLGCASRPRGGTRGKLRVTLTGQALMSYPICAANYDGLDAVVAELATGDVVFSDLEVAIKTSASGEPTRDTEFLHTASPDVLVCLQRMGFDLLALSNNHAWDLGTKGVLATRAAARRQGFAVAGTGPDLDAATRASFIERHGQRVGLVAMATGKIREGAAATASRAGVNELRLENGAPHPADAARILEAISRASGQADIMIAYHHNHDWGDDMAITRPWARTWARRCSDAGADLYVSHGAPLLHGIEVYGDSLHLFGLGSLVFHSRTPVGYYPPDVWESVIVHCDYADGRLQRVGIVPVVLNERGDDPDRQDATRGRPRLAVGEDARRILERMARLSGEYGTQLDVSAGGAALILRR